MSFRRRRPNQGLISLVLIALLFALGAGQNASSASLQEKKAADQRHGEQDEPLKLHSDLVVVSVTVTDKNGQYAHGLAAKDFTIVEDDKAQTVDSFSAEEAPFAAAILVDMSGSMEYKFGMVRTAAASFVDQIRDSDQVAVYGFNNKVRQFQDFTNSHDITDYIWDAKAEDTTRLYDCMNDAITALAKREEKRRAILLISDGCDTSSQKASFGGVMKAALAAGITVYTVDLTEDNLLASSGSEAMELRRGRNEMKEFSNQSGGLYVHSPQGDKLQEAFTNIVDELRNQYTLTYYPTNQKRDGRWRKLSIGAARPGLSVRTRRGYFAPKA